MTVKRRWIFLTSLCALMFLISGCGTFMAHRMVQAPNTYPDWFAPEAPVLLGFPANLFSNFTRQYVSVGPPEARLCYRVIEPADYRLTVSATNSFAHGKKQTDFEFHAEVPGRTNVWTSKPKGTVVLLHGYALAQFSMMPWALELAQEGWRCVLVDLRGHGRSTGKKIYYGVREPSDLSQLLDQLANNGQLPAPVAVMGESYGASMALRWSATDRRIGTVIAITPYAGLSNAVMNLRSEYAGWVPKAFIKAGLKQLPGLLKTTPASLDTTSVLLAHSERVLFVAADGDKITPPNEVQKLFTLAAPGSKLIRVPDSTHETVTYHFVELVPPVLDWLTENAR